MTEQNVYVVVLTKCVVPIQQLVNVQGTLTVNLLVTTATYVLGVTTNWSHQLGVPAVVNVVSYVGSELEVVQERPLEVAT